MWQIMNGLFDDQKRKSLAKRLARKATENVRSPMYVSEHGWYAQGMPFTRNADHPSCHQSKTMAQKTVNDLWNCTTGSREH